MAVNIGPRIGIDGETEYRKAIQGIIQETRTLKAEFEKISSDSNMNPFKKAAEQSKVLTQEIEAQQKRVQELQKGYQEAVNKWGENDTKTLKWKEAIERAETELNNLEAKLKEIPNSIEIIGQKFQAAGEKIKAVGDKISGIGNALTTRVTLPLVGAGTVAVNKFAEVDKTMTLVNQTMQNGADEAALLNQAMKEAAANSTFGMSDAAEASLNFARAGLSATEAASTLAPAMNLAAGEGGDLNTVSAGLIATINGFGDGFDNASGYADIFASACNNSALDIDSLSNSMSVAAPIFKAAGYGVKDAALYMGVMADSGIDANVAANALKTGLARLASPAKEGRVALEKLGIEIFNADGSMKDSVEVQRLLHDSFTKLSEQEQIAAASAIFGKNQMSNWLALINTAPSDVNELSNSLDNAAGTTQKMADAMMSGFGGSLEKLKSSVDVAATSFGEALAPTISKAADAIQKAVDWFNSLDQSQREAIARAALMVAAVGPVLSVGGKLISGIGSVISAGGKLISGVGTIIKVAGGIAPVVTNIGSVVGGVVPAISTALGGVGTFLTGTLIPAIGSVAAGVGSAIAAALPVIGVIAGIVAAGVLLYKNWDTIKEKAHELGQKVSEKWNEVKENTKEAWEHTKESIRGAIENAQESVSGAVENIKSGISEGWNNIKENTSEAWGNVKDTVTDMIDNAKEAVKNRTEQLKNDIAEKWETVRNNTKEAWEKIKTAVSDATGNLLTTVREKIEAIKEAVREKIEAIKEKINGIVDFIKELPGKALEWGRDLISNFVDGIKEKFGHVKEVVTNVADTIKSILGFSEPSEGPLSDFHTYAPDMMKLYAEGISQNSYRVTDAVEDMAGGVHYSINSIGEALQNSGVQWENYLRNFESGKNAVERLTHFAESFLWANLDTAEGVAFAQDGIRNEMDMTAADAEKVTAAIKQVLDEQKVNWQTFSGDLRDAFEDTATSTEYIIEKSGIFWDKYWERTDGYLQRTHKSIQEYAKGITEELEYNYDRLGGATQQFHDEMVEYLHWEYDLDTEDAILAVNTFEQTVSEKNNAIVGNMQTLTNASNETQSQFVLNVSGMATAASEMASSVTVAGDSTSQAMISVSGTVQQTGESIKSSFSNITEHASREVSSLTNDTIKKYMAMAVEGTANVEEMKSNITRLNVAIHDNTTEQFGMSKEEAISNIVKMRSIVSDEMAKTKARMSDEAIAARSGVQDQFQGLANDSRGWGEDIGSNIASGIHGTIDKVRNAVSSVADVISSFLHFSEPDKGPLSNFHTFAPDMMELFAKGIKDNTHLITDQIAKSFDFGEAITMGYGYIPEAGTTNNSVTVGETVINVYGAPGQDVNELSEIIEQKINARYENVRMAWA